MAVRIIIEPSAVWEYFTSNEEKLKTAMTMIAENQEYGIEIYLSNSDIVPLIVVTADNEEVYAEEVINCADCTKTVNEIYDTYLSNEVIDVLMENNYKILDASEEVDMIDERELELDDAIFNLLSTFAPNMFDVAENPDEICEDLKENICKYLYFKYDISVYRPMYLEDENGNDYFSEFPYPEIDFNEE